MGGGGGSQEQRYQYITLLGGEKKPLTGRWDQVEVLPRPIHSEKFPFLRRKMVLFPCPVPVACASCWSPRGQAAGARHWLREVQRLQEPIKADLFLARAFLRSRRMSLTHFNSHPFLLQVDFFQPCSPHPSAPNCSALRHKHKSPNLSFCWHFSSPFKLCGCSKWVAEVSVQIMPFLLSWKEPLMFFC